jgi:hypothetical protein
VGKDFYHEISQKTIQDVIEHIRSIDLEFSNKIIYQPNGPLKILID